jgi:hypothetical protein
MSNTQTNNVASTMNIKMTDKRIEKLNTLGKAMVANVRYYSDLLGVDGTQTLFFGVYCQALSEVLWGNMSKVAEMNEMFGLLKDDTKAVLQTVEAWLEVAVTGQEKAQFVQIVKAALTPVHTPSNSHMAVNYCC